MQILKAKIKGIGAMLHHNPQLANPRSRASKALKEISSKRKKTDEDLEELARREFAGSLYLDKDGEPCIPDNVVMGALIAGAKLSKNGKLLKPAVFCVSPSYKLEYDGPKDPDKMWACDEFVHQQSVKVGTSRIERTRPQFQDWSAELELLIDDVQIDVESVKAALVDAGRCCGIGDYRPQYGRFTVEFQ